MLDYRDYKNTVLAHLLKAREAASHAADCCNISLEKREHFIEALIIGALQAAKDWEQVEPRLHLSLETIAALNKGGKA